MQKFVTLILTTTLILIFCVACSNENDDGEFRESERDNINLYQNSEDITPNQFEGVIEIEPEFMNRLPLILKNNTVAIDSSIVASVLTEGVLRNLGRVYYIDDDNNVWVHYPEQINSLEEPIFVMSDVRSIESPPSYHSPVFFIKSDNSLWGMGNNNLGVLGDVGEINDSVFNRIFVKEPVRLLDNTANIYFEGFSNSGLASITAITTDRELYRWGTPGLDTIYTPEKVLDDVVKYCGNNFAIKSDASLWTWNLDFYYDGLRVIETPIKIMENITDFKVVVNNNQEPRGYVYFAFKDDGSIWKGEFIKTIDTETGEIKYEQLNMKMILENVENFKSLSNRDFIRASFFAFTKDDSLWTWKASGLGQLFRGLEEDLHVPTKICDGVDKIYNGRHDSVFIKFKNNTWGFESGQWFHSGIDGFSIETLNVLDGMINFFCNIEGLGPMCVMDEKRSLYRYFPDGVEHDGVQLVEADGLVLIAENVKLPSETIIY